LIEAVVSNNQTHIIPSIAFPSYFLLWKKFSDRDFLIYAEPALESESILVVIHLDPAAWERLQGNL